MKQPTIRDVARAAGVSPAAVSRHLSKKKVLSAETTARIDAAVAALGYQPNLIATRLSRGRSNILGLVVSDIVYAFLAELASAVEDEAVALGYGTILCNTRNQTSRELDYLEKLRSRYVDGMLFLTNHTDDGVLADSLNKFENIILVDEDVPGANLPRVFADNRAGGRLATWHLIQAGHRRIAYVAGARGMLTVEERFVGYRDAMAEANIPIDPAMVRFGTREPYDQDTGGRGFAELWSLPTPPTAVFAAADGIAFGIIAAARAAGLSLPRDLSIVGFDDNPFTALLEPAITTVRNPAADLGRVAVRMLIDQLAGIPPATEPVRLPVQLVVRNSVRTITHG